MVIEINRGRKNNKNTDIFLGCQDKKGKFKIKPKLI